MDDNRLPENTINETATEHPEARNSDSGKAFKASTKKRFFFLLGFLCCMAATGLFYRFQSMGHFVTNKDYEYYSELESRYGKYNEILHMIDEDPIATGQPGEIDDAKLKELVSDTGDPYAEYYTAEEYREFEKSYSDNYVGIGVGVVEEDGAVIIKTVFDGGPAKEAGIEPEDIILKVDGVKPNSSSDAVSRITGESGTPVEITIGRGSEELDFRLTRTRIDYDSVEYRELEEAPGVGYILIMGFRENTARDFKLAVRDLKNKGCTKFVIDLRDNGGGLTSESIEIADYLLPACKIMSENTKDGTETVYNSKASSADIEFVMLTNVNTASASEILAGAVQDNKGGLIIGEKTYGKGVTQLTRRFKDGTAVKLTITEYFRPSGEKVNEKGITPDIEVPSEEALDAAIKELGK